MHFFETHFTRDTLFHKPHKWFLALLVSPIHAAELYYKKRYHLNFVHARKLFAFDMALLAGILALVGTVIFLFAYDPTVTKDVSLAVAIETPDETNRDGRIRSGEYVVFRVTYKNNSEKKLTRPALAFQLPKTFVTDAAEPEGQLNELSRTFTLPDLAPGSSGEITLSGFFWANAGEEYHVWATLSYSQEGRMALEQKRTTLVSTVRGSVVETSVDAPAFTLSRGEMPLSIRVKNNSEHDVADIRVPLPGEGPFILAPNKETLKTGTIEENEWRIERLLPGEEVLLDALLATNLPGDASRETFVLAPVVVVKNERVRQAVADHAFDIVRPAVEFSAAWTNGAAAQPGDERRLSIFIENKGTAELSHLAVSIPIPSDVVDLARLENANAGTLGGPAFRITEANAANLLALKPGESTSLTINVPIRNRIVEGEDIRLSVTPALSADVPLVPGARYAAETRSPSISVGTNLFLSAQSRYYTAEGDQLGRGPLPPQVGKETKYWAMVTIENTTSRVADLSFSATLPPRVAWTGKSSVSFGPDLAYSEKTNAVTWTIPSLNPRESVGLYMELAVTPSGDQIGKAPLLIQNIRVSARDTFIDADIAKTISALDASLAVDEIGRNKGVVVQ
ncbi:MAG: hypothetical protein A3C90_02055 [Candidatus Magasanikbacteria bacterium RIFCSPHIGHO2_02_FULL_51_14]|uniref:DUF11 domain-containing protein n=1 Tax=Candidatus Magasanikbacteria bacterium RIFCSPHIGHO2_02_FULL_51_14 TaxID=1798683 RepID=A0A1F6MDP8_9BACT|nr:MAG: hypothetical protein A3C90_02055 [Candidatus Magasanikbacteria bacterium RIFCSPHIGHO2_02_FULL_51_14]